MYTAGGGGPVGAVSGVVKGAESSQTEGADLNPPC